MTQTRPVSVPTPAGTRAPRATGASAAAARRQTSQMTETRARAGSPRAPTGCAAAVITATAMATTMARPPIATSTRPRGPSHARDRDEDIAHGPSGAGRYTTRQNVAHPQHLPRNLNGIHMKGVPDEAGPPQSGRKPAFFPCDLGRRADPNLGARSRVAKRAQTRHLGPKHDTTGACRSGLHCAEDAMKSPRRDRGGWHHAITVVALLGAITLVLVVFAPLDGVSDHIAAGQAVGAPGMDSSNGRRNSDLDTRLVLQLGMLFALLYVGFVCLWLSRTRGGAAVGEAMDRLRSRWSVALSNTRARLLGRPVRAAGNSPSMCSIAWKPGHHRSRFQAVISSPGDRRPRVVAESSGLRWPPKDARNPPTRELEAALASLVAKIVAAGWEPVQSEGSWTERRFVWRATNLVALDVGDAVAMPASAASRRAGSRSPWPPSPSLAAAFGGLLLARAVDAGRSAAGVPVPTPQALAHDGLRVQLPGGWASAEAATVPGFSRPLGVGSPREQLSAVDRTAARDVADVAAGRARARRGGGRRPAGARTPGAGAAWLALSLPARRRLGEDRLRRPDDRRRRHRGVPEPGPQRSSAGMPGAGQRDHGARVRGRSRRARAPRSSAGYATAVSDLEAARATGVKHVVRRHAPTGPSPRRRGARPCARRRIRDTRPARESRRRRVRADRGRPLRDGDGVRDAGRGRARRRRPAL